MVYLPRTPMHWVVNHVAVTLKDWKASVSAYSVADLKQVWKRPLSLLSTEPISLSINIKPSFKRYYQMHSKNKCSGFSFIFFHKPDDIPGYTGENFFEQSIGDKCSKPRYPENPSRCSCYKNVAVKSSKCGLSISWKILHWMKDCYLKDKNCAIKSDSSLVQIRLNYVSHVWLSDVSLSEMCGKCI